MSKPVNLVSQIEYFENGNDTEDAFGKTILSSISGVKSAPSVLSKRTEHKNEKMFNSFNSPNNNFELLSQKGYQIKSKIVDVLQGEIFIGENIITKKLLVIKITDINLHKQGITIIDGKRIKVKEDIIHEKNIMQYLQRKNPPNGFIKIIDWFVDKKNYYLIMEHGGDDFFQFVNNHHKRIKNKQLSLKKWKKYAQYLFVQMVLFVKWLHDSQICHLDISLENLLICDGVIRFCDFGLAELFPKDNFKCKKYVGKEIYMCPQIYEKKGKFDAQSADIWSLGICLFRMLCGSCPYSRPSLSDVYYQNISNGYLKDVLKDWSMTKHVDENAYDLLEKILKPNEKERISMEDILKHKYIKQMLQKEQL